MKRLLRSFEHGFLRAARLRRLAARALILSLALAPIGLAAGARWLLADLPAPGTLLERASPDSSKIFDRNGILLYEILDPRAGRRSRVALSDLPPRLIEAVVAVEDAGFYKNPGIDARGVARATLQMLRQRRFVSGGSTITQQLARQLLMTPDESQQRSLHRKLREMLLALAITRRFEKDQILETYLNEVYFGQLAYGIEAASQTYFGKPARQLDLAESSLLVGLIQSPAAYNPLVDLEAAQARQAQVLRLMVAAGKLEAHEAKMAEGVPLRFTGGNVPLEAPHFVTWVLGRLEARFGAERVNAGGLAVLTSLDLGLQRQAEAAVRRQLTELARRAPGKPDHRASDAALVAVDPATGQVLAMVGSADYWDAGIDGAVNVALALRQPGSSIKPFTYAAAFDTSRWGSQRPAADPAHPRLPFSPATVLLDLPTSFQTREGEPYRPLNYDRKWHGPISLRRALATSSNMVAVKVLEAVGTEAMIDTAAAMGIQSLGQRDRFGLALTLGGGEVRLLELTGAFAGLAAGGHRVTPEPILAVLDRAAMARLLEDETGLARLHARSTVSAEPMLDPRVAWLITDILADDRARMPAFGEASVLGLDRPAAAKTGTTTDFRDNWTLGYTPDLATGVWLGNADGEPMRQVSGITGAGPIWQDFMLAAHRGRAVRDFVRPEGLTRLEICDAGGLLADADCRRRRQEYFIAGTEPEDLDPSYRRLALDAASGLAWAPGCRGPRRDGVFRWLPAEARDWGRRNGIVEPPEGDCMGKAIGLASVPASVPLSGRGLGRVAASPAGPALAGPSGDAATLRTGLDASQPGGIADLQTPVGIEPRLRGPALRISSPAEGSTFALSSRLPASAQGLELSAQMLVDVEVEALVFEIDGQVVARLRRPPYRSTWALGLGRHELRAWAETRDGRRLAGEVLRFAVVDEAEIQ